MMTDEEAVALAKAGDERGFEVIYKRHKQKVFAICFRISHNLDDADDLTQDAFLQVWRKLGSFRGASALSTWIYRVTINTILMGMRRKRIQAAESFDVLAGEESAWLALHDGELEHTIDRIALIRAIAALAPGYRAMIVLHEFYGYEHQEVATMLGCTQGNSKSQLSKARCRLEKELTPGAIKSRHHRAKEALREQL